MDLTSILPVWASPGIWLGPRGHADSVSLVNDPSVYFLCRHLLKLLTVFAETVSSSNMFQMLIILSVKKCCRKSVLVLLLCSFNKCPLVLELWERSKKVLKLTGKDP